jgi:hypothetical protein
MRTIQGRILCITIFMLPMYLFGQNKSNFENTPSCTLIVTTDYAKSVQIWINRTKRGKSPLEIDTLRPGFYDVSFLNPDVRDTILNSTNSSSDISFGQGSEFMNIGNGNLFLSAGELARESNCKFTLTPNCRKEIVFHIQRAKDEMKKVRAKASLLIALGVIISLTFLIGALFYLSAHNK